MQGNTLCELTLLRQSQRNDVWRTRVTKRKSTALLPKQTAISQLYLGGKRGGHRDQGGGWGEFFVNGRLENVRRQILKVARAGKNEGRFP